VIERVRAFEALFERIAATRMQGVPMLHPGLKVEAVGFEPDPAAPPARDHTGTGAMASVPAAIGVLVTPWFMNLVWLPLAADAPAARVGDTRQHVVGRERFPFIGAHEPGFGSFEACSLFSPMFEFEDHAAARATAQAVLAELRRPPEPVCEKPPVAARRALLFGRGAAAQPGAAA
jgi:[NiFe] hydrogenase assembly HybE family chaperone